MVRLVEITEENWLEAASLKLEDGQQRFLDTPTGIIARGYAYRKANARVFGIAQGQKIVGLALVKDLDEEPACYDLQQFLVGGEFQRQGYGQAALALILEMLRREGKYPRAEVCVHKENNPALRLFARAGFADTGYIDEAAPDCVNLVYSFPAAMPEA